MAMATLTETDVLNVIRDSLGDDGKTITLSSAIGSVESWDSMSHLGILAALDAKYDGKIANIEELATADSVRGILNILKKHNLL